MRRRRNKTQSTLFPFVSVLICVIGALSFIIVSVGVTSSFDTSSDYVRTGDPILERKAQSDREREIVNARYEMHLDELEETRRTNEELRKSLERIGIVEGVYAYALQQRDSLWNRNNEVKDQFDETAAIYRSLSKKTDNGDCEIVLDPSWRGKSSYYPLLVECNKDGVTVLANTRQVLKDDIAESAYINSLIMRLKVNPDWCLFMLVRQGGVHSFDMLFALTDGVVPIGYYPIVHDRDLKAGELPQPSWLP